MFELSWCCTFRQARGLASAALGKGSQKGEGGKL